MVTRKNHVLRRLVGGVPPNGYGGYFHAKVNVAITGYWVILPELLELVHSEGGLPWVSQMFFTLIL